MDQVQSQNVQQEKKDGKPVTNSYGIETVESYQRRWEQLMQDTNRQIEKIREEENLKAQKANQTSRR